jgi:hypothetical protein
MAPDRLPAIFTIDVGKHPLLTFEARSFREAAELCREEWLLDDIRGLTSNGVPIWDGKARLRSRYATDLEAAFYKTALETAEPMPGELVLSYLVELDGSETV